MKEYKCLVCGYIYSELKGDPGNNVPENTKFDDVPNDWLCPICAAPKSEFEWVQSSKKVENKKEEKLEYKKDETLRSAELSVIFSNLAKGFEKQYKNEEAALAKEISEYYEKRIQETKKSLDEVIGILNKEIEKKFPTANAVCAENKDRGGLRALTWGEKATRILRSTLLRLQKEGSNFLKDTSIYVCDICGYVHLGDELPEVCPICKVPKFKILKV